MKTTIAADVYRHGTLLFETGRAEHDERQLTQPLYGYDFLGDDLAQWRVNLRPNYLGETTQMMSAHQAPTALTRTVLQAAGLTGTATSYIEDRLEVRRTTFVGEAENIYVEEFRRSKGPLKRMVAGHVMRYWDSERSNSLVGALTRDTLQRGQPEFYVATPSAKAGIEAFMEVKPEHLQLSEYKAEAAAEAEFRELTRAFSSLVQAQGEQLDEGQNMLPTGYVFNLGRGYHAVLSGSERQVKMAIIADVDPASSKMFLHNLASIPGILELSALRSRVVDPTAKLPHYIRAVRPINLGNGNTSFEKLEAAEEARLESIFKELCVNPQLAIVDKSMANLADILFLEDTALAEREIALMMQPEVNVDLSLFKLD